MATLATMTVHVGPYEFDWVSYDKDGDIPYLRRGPEQIAADAFGSPEGHAVGLDGHGEGQCHKSLFVRRGRPQSLGVAR